MTIKQATIQAIADELEAARSACSTVPPLTGRYDGLTVEHAYAVQR